MDTLAIEKELWKDIPGYEGAYQISTLSEKTGVSLHAVYHTKNGSEFGWLMS